MKRTAKGFKRKAVRIAISMPSDLAAQIEEAASREDRTTSNYVYRLLKPVLEKELPNDPHVSASAKVPASAAG